MTMEQQDPQEPKESLYMNALKMGAILGAIAIVITILFYVVSISWMGSFKFILTVFCVDIAFIIWAGIKYRNSIGGYIDYGKAYQHGLITWVTAAFVSTLFGLLLYQIIDPDLAQTMTDVIVTNTEESMRNFGAPENSIEETTSKMREDMPGNFTVFGQIKGFGTGIIWYAVLTLLTSLAVRKNMPVEL